MCFIPCESCKLLYTMWCIQTVLYHMIPSSSYIPKQCECITWHRTVWRYHMISNRLKVSHGITKFECITWYKTDWKRYLQAELWHVIHSNLAMQSDTLKMFNSMWYLHIVLYHVMPSICFIPCDAFKLFGIKQFECIPLQNNDVLWLSFLKEKGNVIDYILVIK
jgi:hypothetical protein